jgi:hypothetical protein
VQPFTSSPRQQPQPPVKMPRQDQRLQSPKPDQQRQRSQSVVRARPWEELPRDNQRHRSQSVVRSRPWEELPRDNQHHRSQSVIRARPWETLPRDNQPRSPARANALRPQSNLRNQVPRVPPSVPDSPRRQGPPPTPRPTRLPTPDLDDISGRRFCNCSQHYCEHYKKSHGSDEIHIFLKMNTQSRDPRMTGHVVSADCSSRRCARTHEKC